MKPIPYHSIIIQAIRDERFRDAVLKDPRAALRRAFDIELDDKIELVVVQDSKELVHIVVPLQPGLRGEETGMVKRFLDEVRADKERLQRFRKQPHAVLNAALGFSIPESLEIKVLVETEQRRIIHLPAVGSEKITTPAQAEAFWGGGGDGGSDWTVIDGTYNSGQVCTCYTMDETQSVLPRCCMDKGPGETIPVYYVL